MPITSCGLSVPVLIQNLNDLVISRSRDMIKAPKNLKWAMYAILTTPIQGLQVFAIRKLGLTVNLFTKPEVLYSSVTKI